MQIQFSTTESCSSQLLANGLLFDTINQDPPDNQGGGGTPPPQPEDEEPIPEGQ